MVSKHPDLASLIDTVLEERAQAVSFSAQEIDAQAAKLRQGLTHIRESVAARRRVAEALERLPAKRRSGWLEGVQSAVKVVLGEVRRSSRVLADAANGLLPAASDGWAFAPVVAGVTRGEEADATRVESADAASGIRGSVIVDDTGPERRVLARLEDYPADRAPPVLLIVGADQQSAAVIEVDAEIGADRPDPAGRPRRPLRYEAVLPPGTYYVFFGNARDHRAPDRP
jgi:hypothetical protein